MIPLYNADIHYNDYDLKVKVHLFWSCLMFTSI